MNKLLFVIVILLLWFLQQSQMGSDQYSTLSVENHPLMYSIFSVVFCSGIMASLIKPASNITSEEVEDLQNSNQQLKKEFENQKITILELQSKIDSIELKLKDKNHELVIANNEIKDIKELFESAQNAAGIGIWEIDLITGNLSWSDKVYEIHEMEIGADLSVEKAINFYHPDFRAIIEKAVNDAIATGIGWDLDLILITNKGNELWVNAIGMPFVENNKTIRLRGIFQDINDKKLLQLTEKANQELLELKVKERTIELESINKELEAFSYSVSHDLRSPLRSINGFSKALSDDYASQLDPTAQNYLGRISKAASRMGSLIDDLLDLSRISRKAVIKQDLDLTAMANEIIKIIGPSNQYFFKIEPEMNANGDSKLIAILLDNLIGNAIKYSSKKDNPKIEIGSFIKDNTHGHYVKDNGAGFDPKYADKLFGAFQRLHTKAEFDGSGIGLATVQRIINKHGGKIWAESKPNKGATFYFTLNS